MANDRNCWCDHFTDNFPKSKAQTCDLLFFQIVALGIATWGIVADRHQLVNDGKKTVSIFHVFVFDSNLLAVMGIRLRENSGASFYTKEQCYCPSETNIAYFLVLSNGNAPC